MDNFSRLTLSSVFPLFADPRSHFAKSEAIIKAEVLIHDECTVPASILVEEPHVAAVFAKNMPLIKSGAVRISLRDDYNSLSELAHQKYAGKVPEIVSRYVNFFDNNADYLKFDARTTNGLFKDQMITHLRNLQASTKGDDLDAISRSIEGMQGDDAVTDYNNSKYLKFKNKDLDVSVKSAAKIFYCQSGARILDGSCTVPFEVWRSAGEAISKQQIEFEKDLLPNFTSAAHSQLLSHFALSIDQLYRLPAEEIIEIKAEGISRKVSGLLKTVTSQINVSDSGNLEELGDAMAELYNAIELRCLEEATARKRIESGLSIMDDSVPVLAEIALEAIPLWGTIRKHILRLGTTVSRKTGVPSYDLSMTPIQTYVSRMAQRISTQPMDKEYFKGI